MKKCCPNCRKPEPSRKDGFCSAKCKRAHYWREQRWEHLHAPAPAKVD